MWLRKEMEELVVEEEMEEVVVEEVMEVEDEKNIDRARAAYSYVYISVAPLAVAG